MMIVFWVLVAALVVWLVLVARGDRPTGTTTRQPSADELLAERFARGEIDENEFRRRSQFLEGQKHAT